MAKKKTKRKNPYKKRQCESIKICAYPGCNRTIEPWMFYCYQHHHIKKDDYNPRKLQKVHGGSK